ncbi:MAG: L,D-transpeptidase [Candidatus Didemnitutus sp.]|nr:L,D-transpeptidase [Candidatus Didemnitutus sp.]
MKDSFEQAMQRCVSLGIKPTERVIVVSIAQQRLGFYRAGKLEKVYLVSTSRRPPSNVKDSLGTPRGLHEIAERIGAGAPPGIVFKARVGTGHHFSELSPEEQERNLITTRILWLRGLEPDRNAGGDVDTYSRYVYIHGTNREEGLGTPASSGCVQMGNLDIIELYDEVRTGDQVWIED